MLNKFMIFFWIFIYQLTFQSNTIANETYTIRDIQVDVTGGSALEARTQAMAEAQRQAYTVLLKKMLPHQQTSLDNISNDQLDGLVQSLEVQNEKTSEVRYLGTLTIHFNPQKVQKWFTTSQDQQILLPDDSKGTLIIPVLIRQGKLFLWEENNPWLQTWNQKKDLDSNAFIIPMGDLQDLKNLSAKEALEGNKVAIKKILNRYHASRMIISIFSEDPPSRLEIYHYTPEGLVDHSAPIEFDTNTQPPAELLSFAISKTIEVSKIKPLQSSVAIAKALDFIVKFNTYPQWLEIQDYLMNLPGVTRIKIHSLSLNQAQISLDCSAPEPFIENQLNARGFIIELEPTHVTSKTLSLRILESKIS